MPPDPNAATPRIQYSFGDNVHIQADVFGGTKQETNVYLLRAATGPVHWRDYRDKKRAPYRFLDSYDLRDASIYAGRDADVGRLEREVLTYRLVVLQGPEGVGKTSLLRAGLAPRLMTRGYLVLSARDYVNPTQALINALADARDQLRVDVAGVSDLVGLVRTAQRTLDRPVVLILDHFEKFFTNPALTVAGRARFRAELAAFRGAEFKDPTCLILSVRQRSQGELAYFQQPPDAPAVPDIYHHVVALDLLTRTQARQAVLAPLDGLEPPMVFDPEFIDGRLLPDLAIPGRGKAAIDPPHLQIVCKALYDAARSRGQNFINARLYDDLGGREGILGGYLQRALSEEFPNHKHYELARTLLKIMVSPSGELVPLSLTQAARRAKQPAEVVLAVLDTLVRRSLLLSRAERTFSLAHPVMAQEVLSWFDRREAEVRCAQEMLDHAWFDWLAWDRLRQAPESGSADVARPAPLLSRNRLPEIAACRDDLKITPQKHALLLRSAVVAGADAAPWVQGLARDTSARELVETLQTGGDAAAPDRPAGQLARLLGIADDAGAGNILGRTIVTGGSREVRHAAALALGALGADTIAKALWEDGSATHNSRSESWHMAQALAWMRAAGVQLPELPSALLRGTVAVGDRVGRFLADWQGVAVEALGAALGTAAAYALRALVMVLLFSPQTLFTYLQAFASSLNSAGLGFALGSVTVLVARFLLPEPRPGEAVTASWRRTGAIVIGFIFGLAVGIPAEVAYPSAYLPSLGSLLGRYLGGGALMGLGIALGMVLGGWPALRRSVIGAGAGAAVAGLLIGVVNWLTRRAWLPNLALQGGLPFSLLQAALFGLLTGAGLAGGWGWGRRLWQHWQARQGSALFAGD